MRQKITIWIILNRVENQQKKKSQKSSREFLVVDFSSRRLSGSWQHCLIWWIHEAVVRTSEMIIHFFHPWISPFAKSFQFILEYHFFCVSCCRTTTTHQHNFWLSSNALNLLTETPKVLKACNFASVFSCSFFLRWIIALRELMDSLYSV